MTSNNISLSASLSGSQEVPPANTPATGVSSLEFDAAGNLSYRLTVSGVDLGQARGDRPDTPNTNDDVTLLHIHNAGRGANGPVVFDLLGGEDEDDFTIERNSNGSYTISGVWEPTDDSTVSINNFASAIRGASPSQDLPLYWNLHTRQFPAGAIRGQLQRDQQSLPGEQSSILDFAQAGLDTLQSVLANNDQLRPAKGRRFNGSGREDVYIGDARNNVANGKQKKDVLIGGGGNDRLSGSGGNDVLFGNLGNDILAGGNNRDTLDGAQGDDQLNGGNGNNFLNGGVGVDTLIGGNGIDQLVGGAGVDRLTGGGGRDQFVYSGDPFANGTPALVAAPNINVLNQPDAITDYTIGQDQFVLDGQDLGMDVMTFQKGASGQLANGNVLVLTDGFAAAGGAARAIANNNVITAEEGVFVYFNTTLGKTRMVYSENLGTGGNISVLANLDNQTTAAGGLANIANFTAADFSLG